MIDSWWDSVETVPMKKRRRDSFESPFPVGFFGSAPEEELPRGGYLRAAEWVKVADLTTPEPLEISVGGLTGHHKVHGARSMAHQLCSLQRWPRTFFDGRPLWATPRAVALLATRPKGMRTRAYFARTPHAPTHLCPND